MCLFRPTVRWWVPTAAARSPPVASFPFDATVWSMAAAVVVIFRPRNSGWNVKLSFRFSIFFCYLCCVLFVVARLGWRQSWKRFREIQGEGSVPVGQGWFAGNSRVFVVKLMSVNGRCCDRARRGNDAHQRSPPLRSHHRFYPRVWAPKTNAYLSTGSF